MRHLAIEKIVEILSFSEDMSSIVALDFFAREGSWQTSFYAKHVKQVHAWEIDAKFEERLKENLPKNAIVTIGDSHKLAQQSHEKFDMIVFDNPQGCYGNYCEHFEALQFVSRLLRDVGWVVFNVKTKPYDYENKHEWKARRDSYYGVDSSSLSVEFVSHFYEKKFENLGYHTMYSYLIPRPQENDLYAYFAKVKLTR